MSSHWDYVQRVCEKHDREKPFAPENGQPLKFGAGDEVIFTNDAGIEFPLKVTGFYKPEKPCPLYAVGRRYMLNWECHWFPVHEHQLHPA